MAHDVSVGPAKRKYKIILSEKQRRPIWQRATRRGDGFTGFYMLIKIEVNIW